MTSDVWPRAMGLFPLSKRWRPFTLSVFLLGLTAGCKSPQATLPALKADGLDALQKQHEGADAVVLKDDFHVEYRAGKNGEPESVETTDYAVLILSEAARERFGRATLYYRAELQEVIAFEAKVIRPDQSVSTYSLADADVLPAYEQWVLFSDSRKLRMPFPRPPVGSVVQTRKVVRRARSHLFSSGYFLGTRNVPSVSALFEVCRPQTWGLESRVFLRGNPASHKALQRTENGQVCDRWEDKNIVSNVQSEAMAPNLTDLPEVVVRLSEWTIEGKTSRGFDTPKQMSAWEFSEHYQPMRQVNPDIAMLAAEIVADVPPRPEEQAAALYAWVRDNITYCAISLGMGGWKPHPSTEVRSNRYGDCKDKATFLSALLLSQGIASRPAGIYAHEGYPRPFTLPVLGRFNHAILVVDLPGGPVIVDPTTRTVPFGRLPVGDENAPILPASKGGSSLMTTPVAPPQDHRQKLTYVGEMDAEGNVEGTFRLDAFGAPAWDFRYDLLTTPRGLWPKATERAVSKLAHLQVSTSVIDTPAPPAKPKPMLAKGKATMEVELLGREDISILRLPQLTARSIGRIDLPRRDPIVFKHNRHDALQLALRLPEGTTISSPPPPVHLSTAFASFDLVIHADASGRLIVDRTLVIKQPIVAADRAKEVETFLEEVARAEHQAIVLRRGRSTTTATRDRTRVPAQMAVTP